MDVKVGDRVNGHIVNFVGDMFVEYGNKKRIYRKNIVNVIPSETIKNDRKEKARIRHLERYSDENYRNKRITYTKEYRKRNKDKVKEWGKKYREKHKDKIKKAHREYLETHREQINEYRRNRYRKLRNKSKEMLEEQC